MTRLTTLLALFMVCCLGQAHAGPYQLTVNGSVLTVLNNTGDEVRYSYTQPFYSVSHGFSLPSQASSPDMTGVSASYTATASYGGLHASASIEADVPPGSGSYVGIPYAEASAGAGVGSLDELHFFPNPLNLGMTEVQAFVLRFGGVLVQWSVDGSQQLSAAPGVGGSNLMNYNVQLGQTTTPRDSAQVFSNFFSPPVDAKVRQSGSLLAPADHIDSSDGEASIRIEQSLGVGVSLNNSLGSTEGNSGSANFQNTAKIVGVGLVDKNGNLISPSDYTLSSDSGYAYPLLGSAPATTPEPASLTLLGLGGLALAGYGWRRRKGASPGMSFLPGSK